MTIKHKLQEIQSKINTIEKTGYNAFSKYDYVQLGSILETLNPLLREHKVILTQSVSKSECKLEMTDKGYYSVGYCEVTSTLSCDDSTDVVEVVSSGFAVDKNGDKALFKAITGARKYGLAMLFKAHWDSVEPEQDTPKVDAPRKSSPKTDSIDFF